MSDEQGGGGGGFAVGGGIGVIGAVLIGARILLLVARVGAHSSAPDYTYAPSYTPTYGGAGSYGTAGASDWDAHDFKVSASDGVHSTTDMPSAWAKADVVRMHVVTDADGKVTDAICDGCDALLKMGMLDVTFTGGAGEFDVVLTKQ